MKTKDEQSSIREELSDSPLLSSLYGQPDGYSPLTDDKRAAMVKTVLSSETPVRTGNQRRALSSISGHVRWWAVAASIGLLMALGVWRQQEVKHVSEDYQWLASISDEELEAYVEENIQTFDMALLLESGLIDTEDVPGAAKSSSRPTSSSKAEKIFPPKYLDDDTL